MKKFNPFDRVLIRANNKAYWFADFYDRLDNDDKLHWCIAGSVVKDEDILPYNEETKHLHNTVGEFIKWEPKKGEPILVRDYDHERWTLRIFLEMCDGRFMTTTEPETSSCVYGWIYAKPYINPFKE